MDAPRLEPFGDQDEEEETVAVLRGVDALRSPFTPGFPQFPEHGPFAAFDRDEETWWEADREVRRPSRWVEVRFEAPRDVPFVEILPRRQAATTVTEVEVAGRRFPIEPGWNRIELGLPDVDRLRVRITGRDLPDGRRGGPGALAEVRVPGVRVARAVQAAAAARASDSRGRTSTASAVTYLFTRATGDLPFRRQPVERPGRGRRAGRATRSSRR